MKRTKQELITFKVKQAVGSMAIEGIYLSQGAKKTMEAVANGSISAADVKRELILKHHQ